MGGGWVGLWGFKDRETKGNMRVKKEEQNEGRKLKMKDLKEQREKGRAQTGIETYSVGVGGVSGVEGRINILPFTE